MTTPVDAVLVAHKILNHNFKRFMDSMLRALKIEFHLVKILDSHFDDNIICI